MAAVPGRGRHLDRIERGTAERGTAERGTAERSTGGLRRMRVDKHFHVGSRRRMLRYVTIYARSVIATVPRA
jgi:hypothetical protein